MPNQIPTTLLTGSREILQEVDHFSGHSVARHLFPRQVPIVLERKRSVNDSLSIFISGMQRGFGLGNELLPPWEDGSGKSFPGSMLIMGGKMSFSTMMAFSRRNWQEEVPLILLGNGGESSSGFLMTVGE